MSKRDRSPRAGGLWDALDRAYWVGKDEAASLLMANGAGLNGNGHYVPLVVASQRGWEDVVELLLEQEGLELDKRDWRGWTALMWAAERGYDNIALQLVKAGADHSLENNRGSTAAWLAAYHGQVPVLRVLHEAGADLTRCDVSLAAAQTRYLTVEFLVQHGAGGGKDLFDWGAEYDKLWWKGYHIRKARKKKANSNPAE